MAFDPERYIRDTGWKLRAMRNHLDSKWDKYYTEYPYHSQKEVEAMATEMTAQENEMSDRNYGEDMNTFGNRQATVEALRWHKFPVLDDGFVCLVDVMGDDLAVVQAARVSYGKDDRTDSERHQEALIKLFGKDGGKSPYVSRDNVAGFTPEQHEDARQEVAKDTRNLIRYLMRHRHSTPFEMAEVKLLIRVPMDTWRQWIRHRTANVNEYSTRYTEAIDSAQKTKPGEWRLQSGSNKQGSESGEIHWPEDTRIDPRHTGKHYNSPGECLSEIENNLQKQSRYVYEQRLKFGVAREQARKDLPLSTYTEAYWKCDLHNILHFLALRMDSHAQKEIRDYATVIGEQIIKPLFPIVWEAFEDYRLGAMTLTRLDILMLNKLNPISHASRQFLIQAFMEECNQSPFIDNGWDKEKCRERDECRAKLERLGLL